MDKIMEAETLADGEMKTVTFHGVPVAVIRVGHEYFAIDDTCSHARCSLGTDGYVTGHTVMCACHGATFDITNGNAMTLPATVGLSTYSVVVKDGWIFLGRKE